MWENLQTAEFFQLLGLGEQGWGRYLLAFGALLLGLVAKKIYDIYISRFLLRVTSRTSIKYDEALIKALNPPVSSLFFIASLFVALNILDLPDQPLDIRRYVFEAFRVSVAVVLVWTLFRLTDIFAMFLSERFSNKDTVVQKQFIPLMKKSLRIFVLILGGLLIIQNLGYSVGSLLAGLGIGGLAVALAAQESLSNFFGSIVLLTDRPFKVGDWIEVDGINGDVEEIGFRSTRVRTFDKSQVTFPNKVLANSVVTNWSAMPKRRVRMYLGITYDTSADKVKAFVDGVREIIANHPEVQKDVYMVHFENFNSFSLDIFVHYFTATTKWAEYLRIREEINLEFMRLAERLGVSFAFPSTSLYWGPNQMPQAPQPGDALQTKMKPGL
ncbi:MAG: mechanosensitive ion channel family protein [Bradymonadales bacterium]|nr:MAG: mechanosensitive ion channel family protein [Bradymonadales bacterium]